MYRLIVTFLACISAYAQFAQLATDRQGTRAVFVTPLTLAGEDLNAQPKLLEATAAGQFRTLLSVKPDLQPSDRYPRNFPVLSTPELSSDGATLAWTASRSCIGGSGCVAVELVNGSILQPKGEIRGAGRAHISANGQWAVFASPTSLVSPYRTLRMNLVTGTTDQTIESFSLNGRRVIADDGTIVAPTLGPALNIRRPGHPSESIPTWQALTNVTVSNDARFAVGQTTDPSPSLLGVELATGYQMPLVVAQEGCRFPALSDDGTQLMFLSAANWAATNNQGAVQAWTIDLITGVLMQWTSIPAGISGAILSGDAQSLWAATNDGRLIRLDRPGGAPQEIIPATPSLSSTPLPDMAQGSRYTLDGQGLTNALLRWQGLEIQPLAATNTTLEFILPWAASATSASLEVYSSNGPFQPQAIPLNVVPVAPLFMKTRDFADGTHQDGSPLTPFTPARSGETITLFLRGLGPIDAQGRVLSPLLVQAADSTYSPLLTLEVLDARMDPGREGTYLLTVRLPDNPQASQVFVRPAGADNATDMAVIPIQD